MTKTELIDAIIKASKLEISKAAANTLFDASFEILSKSVKKDGRVAVPSFGVFKLTKRKARKGRNPRTGETIKIKASKSVSFKPSAPLKRAL
ncbi:MAG: HU family DNA-binding protein [Nitrospinota bacterium]